MTGAEGARSLLPATRASYGVALILAPGPVIYLATGRFPGHCARRVARVLGARHLIQAGVSALAPLPGVLAAGAAVDAVHAASMVVLATADRGGRRATATDAMVESFFAAAGFRATTFHDRG